MSISVSSYIGAYSSQGCFFYAAENELLVVAESNSSLEDFYETGKEAILKEVTQQYGGEVANTGICLLGVPALVMKFTLS